MICPGTENGRKTEEYRELYDYREMHVIYSNKIHICNFIKIFKIWTTNKKYINVNFAYKFYFIYY